MKSLRTKKKNSKKPARPSCLTWDEGPAKLDGSLDELKASLSNGAPKQAKTPTPEPTLPFDQGDVNEQASLLTLVSAMFESPNASKTGNATVDFLASVMLSTADDLSIIAGLNNGLDNTDLVDRATLRADWRLRFGVEVARRMVLGEVVR